MAFKQFKTLVLSFVILSTAAVAQNNAGTADKIKTKITTQEANSAFLNLAYEDAIVLYREILENDKTNSFLLYRIGFCHMELNELTEAVESFEKVKASQLKKKHFDFHYAYGKTLHKQGRYNSALAQYQLFEKSARSKDLKYYEVDRYIKQCSFAIKAIENPVSVQITNVGEYINSPYDEYHPIVTLDGQSMYFTSRRGNEKNTDLLPDNQYYENIYVSAWNNEEDNWDEAALIEGKLNNKTDYSANTGVAPDGKSILVYKNVDENNKKFWKGVGSGDIMLSKLGSNNLWGRPNLIEGLNSEYYDGGACFSPDGNRIYFISDRRGIMHGKNIGGKDIWYSEIQEDGTWGKAINLGATVNTAYNEISVFMHPDGKTLFFSSEGHYANSLGGYDVFKTELKEGQWTAPVNLGFPINTSLDEKEFMLSADGKTGWISALKKKENKVDLFQIDLSFYDVISGKSDPLTIVKGTVIDRSTKIAVSSKIKFTNNSTNKTTIVTANDEGEYLAPLVSNTTYSVTVLKKGYESFSNEMTLSLPTKAVPVKKKRPKRKKRGEKEKAITTVEIHQVVHNISLTPKNPLNIVSADLFKTQTVRFVKGENGYEINPFSKDILDNCVKQIAAESRITLTITAHFDDDNNDYEVSLGESTKLGKLVSEYLTEKGATMEKVNVFPMGNNEPMADSDTQKGKEANRRVELKFSL
jgi:outer membrane protein OmpA-like peptidoglycan-associated protein/tetratricopeptide (TPR) repeat protein